MVDRDRWLERGTWLAKTSWTFLQRVWASERTFLLVVVLANVFFARRTFQSGIWADNDSVCHYAYLRHLVEEVYPATGTFLGYSPKFNMGVPFLLYNTPPGLYVLAALTSAAFHLSTLNALKICVVAGFASVPVLGFFIAKTFDDAPRDTPKFAALMLALFSSELYGLDFFFRNGMLNPAIGVPFLLATVYFFRRAQTAPFPETLRHIACASALFAATVCTHLLSAYMLCLALGACVLGRRPKHWGTDVIRLGLMLGLGGAIAAFWLIPSIPFAAKEDAAYTWLRRPWEIVSTFFDGSLWSSYFAGFFPRFITVSNVGIVAIILGLLAVIVGIRQKSSGAITAFLVFILGFWIMLGPTWSFGARLLPGYDRLLWYRFLTLAEVGWLLLAGFGAAYLAHAGARFHPYNRMALFAGCTWAFLAMTERATKVETASEFPEFVEDVDQAAGWLREHGDRRARIFDEFLGQAVIQPPSVNYTRHMMPVLSGLGEIAGWIYENNLAGQVLMKKGVFWYSPFPVVDQAPRYNVKYVLAGSPHFIRALSLDPRWKVALQTRSLVLFENIAYDPALVEGGGLVGKGWTEHYVRGGGYEYDIELAKAPAEAADGPVIIKIGYLPQFTVLVDNEPVATRPSVDGLLQVDLPAGTTPHRLRCTWDISALRANGNKLSLAGVLVALVLAALSFIKRPIPLALGRPLSILGVTGGVVALVIAGVRSRNIDLSMVGFGVRNGITPYIDENGLQVGSYDDDRSGRLVQVLPPAWDKRSVLLREPSRTLIHPEVPAFHLALAARGNNRLLLRGTPIGAEFSASLQAPNGSTTCEVDGKLGQRLELPASCVAGERGDRLPGVTRDLKIVPQSGVFQISRIHTDTGIALIEAETLRNAYDDGGYEAFYSFGAIETPPSNGVIMIADAHYDYPIDLVGKVTMAPGPVEVWLLTRTLHPRFYNTRADVSVWLGGKRIGSSRGDARTPQEFWDRDSVFEWIRVGDAQVDSVTDLKLRIAKVKGTLAGLADVDSIAIAPM